MFYRMIYFAVNQMILCSEFRTLLTGYANVIIGILLLFSRFDLNFLVWNIIHSMNALISVF